VNRAPDVLVVNDFSIFLLIYCAEGLTGGRSERLTRRRLALVEDSVVVDGASQGAIEAVAAATEDTGVAGEVDIQVGVVMELITIHVGATTPGVTTEVKQYFCVLIFGLRI